MDGGENRLRRERERERLDTVENRLERLEIRGNKQKARQRVGETEQICMTENRDER